MKKSLLFIPMLSSLATLPLLIASKCKQEETQEQKDEKLAKKYEKEYIDKQKSFIKIFINGSKIFSENLKFSKE